MGEFLELNHSSELVEAREEYARVHSKMGLTDLLHGIESATLARFPRPQMLSGYLQGSLLSLLSKLKQPDKILEVGTYTAYSTICLATGLRKGGQILSIERDLRLVEGIKKNIELAGISESVKLVFDDAQDVLPSLKDEYDLIFLDASKKRLKDYVKWCLPRLKSDGLMIVDNVLFKNQVLEGEVDSKISVAVHDFNDWLCKLPGLHVTLLPIRDGMSLIVKDEALD